MNSNISLFSVLFPPILHLVLPGFLLITNPSKQQQQKCCHRKYNLLHIVLLLANKIFYKDRMCLLKKFAVDSTLLLKVVPSNPCKMQIKSP